MFPSSQYPVAIFITNPSPHISEQELEVRESPRVHEYPVSTEQVELHPSPLVVPPSSQYPVVGLIEKPSPQMSLHELDVVEDPNVHFHFASIVQVELHPSPSTLFPSSQ